MDDEDEVKQSSSTVEQPIAEAPEVGETRVSEQCDVVLSVEDDSVKSLSMANNAENVEESKVEDAKVEEMVPAVVDESEDGQLEVRNEEVVKVRENEGANVEESKSEVAKVETDGEGSVEKLVADDDVVGMKEDELVEEKKEEEALIEEAKEEELAVEANEEASNYKLKEEEELVEEKKEEEALVEETKLEELIEEEKEEELAAEAKEEELAVEANEEASNYKSKEEEELVDGAKEEVIEEASIKELKEEGLVEEASIKESKEEGLVEEAREEALIEESKEEELVEEAKEEELIEEQKEEALDEDMKQDESIEEKVENENKGEHSEDVVMVKEEGEDRLKTENLVEVECGDEAAKADKVVQDEGGEEVEKEDDEEEDGGGKELEDSEGYGDEEVSRMVEEDKEVVKEEEMPNTDTEMEKESEVVKSGSGGKRRRGRSSKLSTPVKSPAKSPSRKTVGEDVCFICLDGGDLVLCDRRGCPKAYHPSCVDHDEEFFKTKGRWNCGWHLCNQCGKNAYFLCYTCTFSLCKGCSKDAVIFCLRGSKGFCESCMKTVMMIESNEQNEMGAAFDDKSSWEYLFKDYWIEQKAKLGISSDELAQAKNPLRDYDASDRRQKPVELDDNNDVGTDLDNSPANIEMSDSKRKRAKRRSKPVGYGTDSSSEEAGTAKKKSKRRLKSQAKDTYSDPEHTLVNQGTSRGKRVRRLSKSHSKDGGAISGEGNIEWASQELLEFVMHMKNGDSSVLTQFDVQGLLLEYIKRNKLRDPCRQSQIICDSMLQKLFGKARVGHFEMLKLLESHFLLKEDSHVDNNQGNVVDTEISPDDHNDDSGKMRGRKSRKRAENRGQSNLEDYAAIDRHNISLIYLRRGLMESLMDNADMFHEKVIGSFVRIRISGSSQKQDIYRLVQIIGTSKAPEAYKVGKRTTDAMLEILNLDKTEIVSIDSVSNQEFTEDECKRLRQSIKCGLISRMTVGDVLEKARELQEVRVTDWLEAEIVRLSHLRDRASEKGRKKELRECVEKLQLLKTPEERQRRLNETPEVHADPKMDPSCVSDDENENLDKRQASNTRPRDSGFFRSRVNFSSRKVGSVSNDSWSANVRPSNQTTELGRNLSNKGVSGRREDSSVPSKASDHSWSNGVDRGTPRSNNWEKPKIISDTPMSTQVEHSGRQSDLSVAAASEPVQPSSAAGQIDVKVNETEKTWHYRDPTGKVQGPFSMSQLRKWSNTGYFPAELRIWRTSQMEDDSILLTEALDGKFQKESQTVMSNSDVGSKVRNTPSSVDTVKLSGSRYDSTILPSPTPTRSPAAWSGKQTSSIFQSTAQFRGNERLPSPTPTSPSSDRSSVDRSNIPQQSKGNLVGNRQENVVASIGTVQPPAQFASNSGMASAQQFSSQSVLNVANQPFAPPDAAMNQTIVGPNAVGCGQGFSNMVQPGTGQNPPIYTQNWGAGYVARPEMVNANLTPNNQTAVQPAQYSQWTGASVSNQAPPYAGGYPPGQGNIAANFPAMPMNTAWRPGQTNLSWAGQQQQLQLQQQQQQLQQQPVGQNAGWTGPSSGSMAQMAPSPSTPAMVPGPASAGWSGTGPSPTPGNTNMVWVGAPGNSGTWGGDQNRNGGGTQPQWNRQSSFGSGGQRVCKYFREHGNCRKGSSCDYMHT